MIEITPILTDEVNLGFEIPVKKSKNNFEFYPVRFEYLMKIDDKKHTFETIQEMQNYIYSSNHVNYSFRGIIFYCGFFVNDKFDADRRLDLNREVKYILHSDKIGCLKATSTNKRVFMQRIRDWNEKQDLEGKTVLWCEVDDFKLRPFEITGEIISITSKEFTEELERLKNLPQDEGKVTFFAKIRKMLGL